MKVFELLTENIGQPTTFTLTVPTSKQGLEIADLQKVLQAFKYNLGPRGVDGILGDYTEAAIKSAQQDVDQTPTGVPDQQLIDILNQVLQSYPDFAASLTKTSRSELTQQAGNTTSRVDISAIQDTDFGRKLQKIANALGVNANDILAIMNKEAGSKREKAVNKQSGATGLIQFMPKTARELGTSTQALAAMSDVDQLDYVYKYLKQYVKPGDDRGTIYMKVFYPAAANKPDNHVISSKGSIVYSQNRGLDINHDGQITVGDVKRSV